MNESKLTKAEERRLLKILFKYRGRVESGRIVRVDYEELKQHLADELARVRKEMVEKLEGLRRTEPSREPETMMQAAVIGAVDGRFNQVLDQAIKTIKDHE